MQAKAWVLVAAAAVLLHLGAAQTTDCQTRYGPGCTKCENITVTWDGWGHPDGNSGGYYGGGRWSNSWGSNSNWGGHRGGNWGRGRKLLLSRDSNSDDVRQGRLLSHWGGWWGSNQGTTYNYTKLVCTECGTGYKMSTRNNNAYGHCHCATGWGVVPISSSDPANYDYHWDHKRGSYSCVDCSSETKVPLTDTSNLRLWWDGSSWSLVLASSVPYYWGDGHWHMGWRWRGVSPPYYAGQCVSCPAGSAPSADFSRCDASGSTPSAPSSSPDPSGSNGQDPSPSPTPLTTSPSPSPPEDSPDPSTPSPSPAPAEDSPDPSPPEDSPAPSPPEDSPAPSPPEDSPDPSPPEDSPDPSTPSPSPAPALLAACMSVTADDISTLETDIYDVCSADSTSSISLDVFQWADDLNLSTLWLSTIPDIMTEAGFGDSAVSNAECSKMAELSLPQTVTVTWMVNDTGITCSPTTGTFTFTVPDLTAASSAAKSKKVSGAVRVDVAPVAVSSAATAVVTTGKAAPAAGPAGRLHHVVRKGSNKGATGLVKSSTAKVAGIAGSMPAIIIPARQASSGLASASAPAAVPVAVAATATATVKP